MSTAYGHGFDPETEGLNAFGIAKTAHVELISRFYLPDLSSGILPPHFCLNALVLDVERVQIPATHPLKFDCWVAVFLGH